VAVTVVWLACSAASNLANQLSSKCDLDYSWQRNDVQCMHILLIDKHWAAQMHVGA
jgi:hypothetical protein